MGDTFCHSLTPMPSNATLNVSLTPELTALIAARVASGRTRSGKDERSLHAR